MNKNLFKRVISFILITLLCFNVSAPSAINSYATEGNYLEVSPDIGEKRVILTADSIVIDGNTISKEEFTNALSKLYGISNTPIAAAMLEYGTILSEDAKKTGGLISLGLGISLVFTQFIYKLNLATITNKGPYKFSKGTFQNISRDIIVIFTDDSVVVDGVPMALNWLSYALVEYVAANQNIIPQDEAFASDEVDWKADENTQHHIANGTNGGHRDGWQKFGIDPDDPDFYAKTLPILKQAVDEGIKSKDIIAPNGTRIIEYIFRIEGTVFDVWVSLHIKAGDIIPKITDACINH